MDFEKILHRIRHPSRYLGCEVNAWVKDPAAVSCRVALAYPDLYQVAMSYLGLQVLYDAVNREDDLWAERVFAPDTDLEAALHTAGLPLSSLESRTPLNRFDLVGFTLQHELNYSDVLAMLKMGSIPLRAAEREVGHPFVVAGGPCASNPEPLAPAFDAVFLGDAELGLVEMARIIGRRRKKASREEILDELMGVTGVYLPGRYRAHYGTDGSIREVHALDGAPERVRRRLVQDINHHAPPTRPVVACSLAVHERLAVEIQRGCTRGCRFCQAGMINRPVRQRRASTILEAASRGLERTGHDQVGFLSLSAGDHPQLIQILEAFLQHHQAARISASLPSLRAETLTPTLASVVGTSGKSGFTIAPEVGNPRLRKVINKPLTDEDVILAATSAFTAGFRLIKLYFMVGLPTETKEDRWSIVDLVERISKEINRSASRVRLNVGLSTFVPKPHTPFQWERMISPDEALQAHQQIKKGLKRLGGVKVGWTRTEMSRAEGLLSRGDRRQFAALVSLVESGQRLSGWSEHFRPELFQEAFGNLGLPGGPEWYLGVRPLEGVLPWDHLDLGPSRAFLAGERSRALEGTATPDCTQVGCYDCGACAVEDAGPILDDAVLHLPLPKGEVPLASNKKLPRTGPGSIRVRLTLAKQGPAVHLSHLEFAGAMRRALRRAGWPLAFTEGFHPRPKLSFGPACPVGVESRAELLDVNLAEPGDLDRLLSSLRSILPAGLTLLDGKKLPEEAPGIMQQVKGLCYRFRLSDNISISRASSGVDALVRRTQWLVERLVKGKKKTVDVRPSLRKLEVVEESSRLEVLAELDLGSGCVARPAEMAREAFGCDDVEVVREAVILAPDAWDKKAFEGEYRR